MLEEMKRLLDEGTREEILEWLQRDDPNGCYTDAECISQGMSTASLADAQQMMQRAIRQIEDNVEAGWELMNQQLIPDGTLVFWVGDRVVRTGSSMRKATQRLLMPTSCSNNRFQP